MPRKPKPRWHAGNQVWCSDVGEEYTDAKGRKRRRTVPFPDIGRKQEREARDALQAYLDAEAERQRNSVDPTVATVTELYLEWLENNGRAPSTIESNVGLLSKFAAWTPPGSSQPLAARPTSTLEPEDLETLLADMATRHKPTYAAVLHSAVMGAFNWAAKRIRGRVPEILIPRNPFKDVPKPSIPRAPDRYAERKELAAFLRWAWRHANRKGTRSRPSLESRFDRNVCLMLRLIAHSGARPGELCIAGRIFRDRGFWWEHWDPNARVNELGQRIGVITLPPEFHKTGRKTQRPREIVVPPLLTRALERLRSRPWAHPKWVFCHRRGRFYEERGATTAAVGEPWTSQGLGIKITKWRRLAIAAGKVRKENGERTWGLELLKDDGTNKFHLYRIRHTKITNLLMAGLSNDQAAALTGTSGKMVESIYGHLTGSRLIDLDQRSRARTQD